MQKDMKKEAVRMLSAEKLGIKGLELLGYANFLRTHETLPPHSHNGMEFIAVIKGTQSYTVADKTYSLRGGDVFMTRPGEFHSNGHSPQEVAEIIWFQIDIFSSEGFLGMQPPNSEVLLEGLSSYNKRVIHAEQKELGALKRAYLLFEENNAQSRLLGFSLLLGFIAKHFCSAQNRKPDEQKAFADISAAEKYINEHLTENPELESIAAHLELSVTKFNLMFKEKLGITPHAYIISRKIELAKELLKAEKTVTEIAYILNFSSSDYFSSVFKKYTGLTPTQYRRRQIHINT